jgi:GNAT superfamily N-acetyltransferase
MPDVRSARREDAARLSELSRQLGYPSSEAEVEARLNEILGRPDHAIFVAEDAAEVVGWIQVSLSRLVESPFQARVGGLVVDERRRSRGIGPLLLRHADAWALERGCGALRVPCNVARKDAHHFYEREGFREVKVQRVFERAISARAISSR